jgi:hypothetical protein
MANVNIPGLIAKENDSKQKQRDLYAENLARFNKDETPNVMTTKHEMTLQEIANQYPGHDVSQVVANYGQSYVDYTGTGLTNPLGVNPYIGDGWKTRNPGPFGGVKASPQRQVQDNTLFEEMLNSYMKPPRSTFEDLLDSMFSVAEKEQFLISVGYEFEHKSENESNIYRKIGDLPMQSWPYKSLATLFLQEITIKFKNLLLTKATLKIKI